MADKNLKRTMGLTMATALVVGNMVGSGVFLLPASLASVAGPVSIIGWVFTGIGAMLLALVFARLGRTFPRTGGPYAYSRRAFGDFIGFQTAWGYWIAAWAGNAAIAVAFVGYLAVFWGDLGSNNLLAALVGIAVIWLLTFVNIAGARETGAVQVVTTVLKFVPLAIIGVVGLFFIDGDNLTPFAPEGTWSAISAAAPLTLWAFIGLESATVAAGEVKDPERTIPRATIIGTLAATLVYILTTVAVMGVVPQGAARRLVQPVRARRRRDVRRRLGQGHRARRDGRHVRSPERLDHAAGTRAARRGRGRPLPRRLRQGARRAQDPRLRAGRVVGARLGPDAHELHAGPRRGVHVHHPAGHADDARAVRVQRRRAGPPVPHRAGAVRPAPLRS